MDIEYFKNNNTKADIKYIQKWGNKVDRILKRWSSKPKNKKCINSYNKPKEDIDIEIMRYVERKFKRKTGKDIEISKNDEWIRNLSKRELRKILRILRRLPSCSYFNRIVLGINKKHHNVTSQHSKHPSGSKVSRLHLERFNREFNLEARKWRTNKINSSCVNSSNVILPKIKLYIDSFFEIEIKKRLGKIVKFNKFNWLKTFNKDELKQVINIAKSVPNCLELKKMFESHDDDKSVTQKITSDTNTDPKNVLLRKISILKNEYTKNSNRCFRRFENNKLVYHKFLMGYKKYFEHGFINSLNRVPDINSEDSMSYQELTIYYNLLKKLPKCNKLIREGHKFNKNEEKNKTIEFDNKIGTVSGDQHHNVKMVKTLGGNPNHRIKNPLKMVSSNKHLHIRCCLDNDKKIYHSDYGCHKGNYNKAKEVCKLANARLCSVNEINNMQAAKTGCHFDRKRIWSSEYSMPYKQDQSKKTSNNTRNTTSGQQSTTNSSNKGNTASSQQSTTNSSNKGNTASSQQSTTNSSNKNNTTSSQQSTTNSSNKNNTTSSQQSTTNSNTIPEVYSEDSSSNNMIPETNITILSKPKLPTVGTTTITSIAKDNPPSITTVMHKNRGSVSKNPFGERQNEPTSAPYLKYVEKIGNQLQNINISVKNVGKKIEDRKNDEKKFIESMKNLITEKELNDKIIQEEESATNPYDRLYQRAGANDYKLLNHNVNKQILKQDNKTVGYKNNVMFSHMEPNKKIMSAYGWSYMPPQTWSVPQKRPPVCIPSKNNTTKVMPILDKGAPVDSLNWTQVGSILPKFEYKENYNPDYYYPGWKSQKQVNYPKINSGKNFSNKYYNYNRAEKTNIE